MGDSQPKKKISLATCPGKTPGPIYMVFGLNDADFHKEVPFGNQNDQLEKFRGYNPLKQTKISGNTDFQQKLTKAEKVQKVEVRQKVTIEH